MGVVFGCSSVRGFVIVASLLLAGFATVSGQEPVASTSEPREETASLQFNFKGAPFDQVLDYFSRATGKPVIREAAVPDGTLDFLSPETYDLDDGLRVLNIILQSRGVMLRIEDDMLYLQSLTEMQRENVPTFIGELPADITNEKIVTMVRPLESAVAQTLADRLKELVASYGSITAMPGQNSIVITETASQVRRLLKIIAELDQQAPDSLIEIIRIRNATASDLLEPLKALLKTKTIKYMFDKKGNMKQVEEDSLSGLNITADNRSNSIIGKGPRTGLDKLKEIVAVLDVSGGNSRSIRTLTLGTLSPQVARDQINNLFKSLPPERRPSVMVRAGEPAITVVAERAVVDEAVALINELDGGSTVTTSGGLVLEAVSLLQGHPDAVIEALQELLNQRQKSLVRLVAGPDNRSLLISGPEADVAAVASIIPVLDRADGIEQEIRMIRIEGPASLNTAAVLAATTSLHVQRLREDSRLQVTPDSVDPRLITLVGPRREVESWIELVKLVSDNQPSQRETRTYTTNKVRPSELVEPLRSMTAQLMGEPDGPQVEPPSIQAIDALDTLIISAAPGQYAVIDQLLSTLDQQDPSDFRIQVIDVSEIKDLAEIMARARAVWEQLRGDDDLAMPDIEVDADAGRLLVSGPQQAVARYEQAIATFRRLEAPGPDLTMVPLKHAAAAEVASYLDQFVSEEQGLLRAGSQKAPTIEVIERTNTLVIGGNREQQQLINTMVKSLDVDSAGERAPLRILQLQVADAAGLARTLNQQYEARSVQDRAAYPVRITADPNTNSLFVSAHPTLVDEIDSIVANLNTVDRVDRDGREIRIFPLRVARAEELARTIDEMFPDPPMPLDRRGKPVPSLQEPREVVVRADVQTNSLIVEAPVARMASFKELVEQLDRQKVLEEREVRTYQPLHADLNSISSTLKQLASSGSLHQDSSDRRGTITVATEPVSGTLIISGPAAIFTKVEQVLEELDVKRATPATTLRFFALRHADADRLAETLRNVLLVRMREEIPGGDSEVESLLNVSSDEKTNTLIVSAPVALMPVAESLIEQLDTPAAARSRHAVRIRPLDFADASTITTSLAAALPELTSTTTGEPVDARLISSSGANALIMVGLPEDLEQVEELVATLDARPSMDAINAKTYVLEHASADRLAPLVERLLADQQASDPRLIMERIRRSRGQVDLTPPIRVEADERTNSLIVSGPTVTVALAETLIQQLDVPDERATHTWKTYTPITTDSVTLSAAVRQILNETSPSGASADLSMTPEPLSGAVVVTGPEDQVDRAIEMLASWDKSASPTPRVELRILDVAHGDASTTARVLTPLLRDRSRWPRDLQAMARSGRSMPEPSVTVDTSANRILVSAPAAIVSLAADLLKELDRPGTASGTVDVQVLALRQADAAAVAKTLQESIRARSRVRPGEAGPAVSAQPSGNAIVVTGTPDQIAELRNLVAQLDEGFAPNQTQVRTVYLEYARAERVAPIVEQLLVKEVSPELTWFNSRRGLPMPETEDVRVVADPRLNAVIVAATPAILSVAEQMVAQLDVDPNQVHAAAMRRVAVMQVRNADARELAASLEALFAESGTADPPAVRVDASSNTLLVRGDETQLERIQEVVREVDAATLGTSRQVHLVPIDPSRGSAADMAESLRRMLDRGTGSRVEVIKLEDLLKQSAEESDEGDQSRGGALPLPAAIASLGFGHYSMNRYPQFVLDQPEVSLAVDPVTNSLVIVGSDRAVKNARAVLEQLVQQTPAAPGTVRRIELGSAADAGALAQMLRQTMQQMTTTGGARGDLMRRTSLVVDQRDNALVFVCNDADFRTITQLIGAFGRSSSGDATVVKAYPLNSIPADQAVRSVNGLLQRDARGRGQQGSRMRSLALRQLGNEKAVEAVFSPDQISVIGDGGNNTIIVMAPSEAIGFIDQFIELIDQSPVSQLASLKLFKLKHARAADLGRTLRNIFQVRHRNLRRAGAGQGLLEPEFGSDARMNMLLVTASARDLKEVDSLLDQLDQPMTDATLPLQSVVLKSAVPSRAVKLLDEAVFSVNPARRQSAMVVADDASGIILVRADEESMSEIRQVLSEIDRDPTNTFDVRTIALDRADPNMVSEALQQLFDDRARMGRGGRKGDDARRVTIVANPATRLLMVSASDEDYAQVEKLVKQLDSIEAAESISIRAIPLKNAKAEEISETVQGMVIQLESGGPAPWWFEQQSRRQLQGRMAIYPDTRLNALVVSGSDDSIEMVERIVKVMDANVDPDTERKLKVYRVEHVPIEMLEDVVQEMYGGERRRWWQPATNNDVSITSDRPRRALIVAASSQKHKSIAALVAELDQELEGSIGEVVVLPVKYAEASDVAQILSQFMQQRSRTTGRELSSVVIPSRSSNSIILSGSDEELPMLRDLVSQVDIDNAAGDRSIEIIAIQEGEVDVIAGILREQFGRRGANQVMITTVPQTRSLVLNAPAREMEKVKGLIVQLDTRAPEDETLIRTFALDSARARNVVGILADTLQLDATGEARGVAIRLEPDQPAVEVNARVVADDRSNSVIVTANEESLPVIEKLIRQLDEEPAASEVEYRIFDLEHALAEDVRWNLYDILPAIGDPSPRFTINRMENQLIVSATPDQFKQIEMIILEFDKPSSGNRSTKFIPLEFAEAEKVQEALTVFYGPYALDADSPAKLNVRIVADPATNSLVISAEESEWDSLNALIEELDAEEYDSSLQLKVIPLTYADAVSVARAINEAFQQQVRGGGKKADENRASGNTRDGARSEMETPTVLVQAEDWVRASAEPVTNSVVVSATLKTLRKIETIVGQLDIADHAGLPPARVIPVRTANPEQLASSVRTLYATPGREGRVNLRIVGDVESSTLIVRAPEEDFLQIMALAKAIEEHGDDGGMGVHVIRLKDAPAARIADAIRSTYQTRAKSLKAAFQIEVDSATNSLVVAASADLVQEIKDTVSQLDGMAPASGLGIFIIELQHVDSDEAIRVIRTIGLDKPQPEGSVMRLLGEPVKISPLQGRNAVVIVASPADEKTITGIFKALDAEPELATARMEIVPLQNAEAEAIASILEEILAPGEQQVDTPMARAIQEQIRRLSVQQDGVNSPDFGVDLTRPIRIIAHETRNAILVSSTEANVAAVVELVAMLDQLPVTEAVVVRLFPLENIAADDFARIVRTLFDEGKDLGRVPGAEVAGVPVGSIGRALLDEVAIAVDERTNTVVIAGKEESVAAVEVISARLDSDLQAGWVEPRLVPLTWADPGDLAQTLNRVLVEGATDLPQAGPLQQQVGRLRVARMETARVIESEVFQPMSRLIIEPQEQMRALMLVGTPINLELVSELVAMLDVEAASPASTVRIYPVQHASAARLSATVETLFREQVSSGAIRKEDRVIIQADERTNSLVVTTSTRSFTIFETLLDALDSKMAPELQEIKRLPVTNASASRLSTMIQRLMDARVERLRLVEPETADLQRATIIPDERTNSLVIAAGNDSYDVIKMLVEQMDEANAVQDGLVEVVGVGDANPDRLASAINSIMERRYAELPARLKNRRQPLILTDPRTSSLLVSADPEDLSDIQALVEQLIATPLAQAVDLHVIPVAAGSNAERLAPRIQQLMRDRQQSLGEAATPSDRVSVTGETASNSLIVAASQENLVIVQDMVSLLVEAEAESTAGRGFEVLALRSSSAEELVDLLDDLYVEEANRNRGSGTVRVTAEPRLNSIVVSAPQNDIDELKVLVARLDGAKPAFVIEIRHYPLKSANALETVSLIEDVLSGRGLGSRRRS
ncbi:MAG: hypothetical protein MK089_05845, partial [Phycisphaerales bacterium]|nr:hypothetical protein [Phycisphaerales bacterium]